MVLKLRIEGDGITVEREITDAQMVRILGVVAAKSEALGDSIDKYREERDAERPSSAADRSAAGRSRPRRASKKAETYPRVDLRLSKDQHKELAAFYQEKRPAVQNDQVLVVMHWLLNNTDRQTVTRAEIFSALRGIPNVKIPARITSVVSNLRIDGHVLGEGDELSLHHLGEHYVEQNLPKASS